MSFLVISEMDYSLSLTSNIDQKAIINMDIKFKNKDNKKFNFLGAFKR